VAKQDPKENQPLMPRRSQWQALRGLAKAHGCAPGDIVGARIEVHLDRFKKAVVTTVQPHGPM